MTLTQFFSALIFCTFSAYISFCDAKTRLIPLFPLYAGIILLIIFYTVSFFTRFIDLNYFASHIIAALLSLSLFTLVYLAKKEALGLGDVKYSFFCGLFAGLPEAFIGFFLSCLLAFTCILAFSSSKRKKIPFAPFLFAGTIIPILVKNLLNRYYIK